MKFTNITDSVSVRDSFLSSQYSHISYYKRIHKSEHRNYHVSQSIPLSTVSVSDINRSGLFSFIFQRGGQRGCSGGLGGLGRSGSLGWMSVIKYLHLDVQMHTALEWQRPGGLKREMCS